MSDPDNSSQPRRFFLRRVKDVSGVSGTGKVAEGVEFTDGKIVIRWKPSSVGVSSTSMWDCLNDMITVHGHGGSTTIEWID